MKKKFSIAPMTKKIVPVILAAVFSLPLASHAAIKADSFELSPFVGYNVFEKDQNLKNSPIFGARFGYNFNQRIALEGAVDFINSNVDDETLTFTQEGQFTSPIDDVQIAMYHLDLLYHFMPDARFNPFITAGYGMANYDPKINNRDMAIFNLGVGAKFWLAEHVALRLDLRDQMVFDERINNLQGTLGLVFAFGGNKKTVAAAPVYTVKDNTAPTIIFTSPINGSTAVAANQKTNVAFSEKMDPATINTNTFTLKQGTVPVSGKVTAVDATATFIPSRDLEKNKAYIATITAGAKDPAGNALGNDYEWGFTTGAVADTTPPTVIFTSPVKDATNAPVNQKVHVAFSEAIDPTTMTASTFIVRQGTTVVPGKVTTANAVATFTPASDFEKGKIYTGTVTTATRDLAGNTLVNSYVWDFTAHSAAEITPCVLATLEDSHFLYNSATINENGKTILDLNIKILKESPEMDVRIAGYASAAGTEEYNQALSERRANAVKDYLVKEGGISNARLETIGYGETSPIEYEAIPSDINSAAAKANMKVIFQVIVK